MDDALIRIFNDAVAEQRSEFKFSSSDWSNSCCVNPWPSGGCMTVWIGGTVGADIGGMYKIFHAIEYSGYG